MFGNRVKIDDGLLMKAKKCSELAGYADVEEFVNHVLEKEITKILGSDDEQQSDAEVKKRLQGLGYIE
ncbi:MAG: hypothetical protein GZ088_04460 [Acidipila sp.]|nr:hypothetical protein [Acidipila sp.]